MEIKNNEYEGVMKKLSDQLQRSRIGDYIDLMQNPVRMIGLNFLAGIARGFGAAVGFTILGAVLIYFLQRIVILNIPIISGVLAQIAKMIKLNM
ncbi:MAG TPA: hypothetical protein DEF85_09930 [Clostridiaceae bacterium]|jgi:hypothetical protein|nr:hypothetical protein [Clostridiaceae bacterium]HBN28467.1 hypothetical protein [Clostridiaceae bacterium]HBX49193.1 hypothetical protein [Clostridiaceae bacterium]HCL50833.1 hypothetical protein [Clostridiaceae bacterium]